VTVKGDRVGGAVVGDVEPVLRVLGPVTLWAGGAAVDVGPSKQRALLAALAVDAARPVSVEALITRIWDEEPPPSARGSLYVLVARLRRALSDAGAALDARPDEWARVRRRAGGYVLEVPAGGVDLRVFRSLRERAGGRNLPEHERAELLGRALELWSGPALGGVPGSWAQRVRAGLAAEALEVLLAWGRIEVSLGHGEAVIGRLRTAIEAFPLVEPLVEVQMLALHGAGRDSEAVGCYLAARARLAEELGTEPGRELQERYAKLLRGELNGPVVTEPANSGRRRPAAPAARRSIVPRELPAPVATFTGRADELATLCRWLDGGAAEGSGAPTTVISAVSGTAGVGKTALAVLWAHQVRSRFPDGQLYVNLRGYDLDQPMTSGEALARLLAGLGVAGQDVPADLAERAGRYRTATAGLRLLIVLDNASSAEQVRPLLPGDGSGAVIVTSRDALAGLVARDGAHRLDLDLLPLADAIELLRRLIGARVDAEPDAAARLAGQCARLPLALRVAAELTLTRSTSSLGELVAELDDRQRLLDLLDADGDPRTAVRAVFSWSVRQLPPGIARTFLLLGLHPGPDLEAYAAAALAGSTADRLRPALEMLARAHLIQPTTERPNGGIRYGMHDLLRAYAVHPATTDHARADGAGVTLCSGDSRAALERLFDYYLAAAAAAMDGLYPDARHRRPSGTPAVTPVPVLTDPDAARAWLETELPCLIAVAAHTAVHGWPAHTVRLSTTLFRYLWGNHLLDALTLHGHALEAARLAGDRAGEGQALTNLGLAQWQLGRPGPAVDLCEQALALFRRTGDLAGQARAVNNLAMIEERLGRYGPAFDHLEHALSLYREVGDDWGEAGALSNLGTVEAALGRNGAAVDHLEQALARCRELGHRSGEAAALGNLGDVEQRLGRCALATDHHEQARALYVRLGDRSGVAWCTDRLGSIHARCGRTDKAAEHHKQALDVFRDIGEREGQALALNGLGEAARLAGRPGEALAYHTQALAIATETGARDQQALAHDGLAHARHALGAAGQRPA
jgi:DNA-binding SARP family transcriptional activator